MVDMDNSSDGEFLISMEYNLDDIIASFRLCIVAVGNPAILIGSCVLLFDFFSNMALQ